MIRYFQFIILMVLTIPFSYGQNINQTNSYTEDSIQVVEKVYLHIDRDSYYPGDDIWFKAYLVNGSGRLLSSHSKNLHVELISPSSEIIDPRVIKMEAGLGNGDFHLSDSLKSGRYRLRAYTNYMRNFGNELFFSKNIYIINSRDADKSFTEGEVEIYDKPKIYFFPEGGSLVDNVVSNVAFKATDAQGKGYDVSGEVYSSANEKITDLKSTHAGMGMFSLEPAPGLRYFAIVKNRSGVPFRYDIPAEFSNGVVLSVVKNQKGQLLLVFKTNPGTLTRLMNHDLSLTVSDHIAGLKTFTFRMKSLNSFLNLPTEDLPGGIIKLTLSGADSIPLCERLVFLKDREDTHINLETNKILFNKRDSVSVRINLSNSSGKSPFAFLSLSATDNFFTDKTSAFPSTISSWFLLESEVRGVVEDPSYYFDPSNPDRLKDLDILLLTQGWRDFEWKYKEMKYPSEYGFTISGRARKIYTDSPLKNSSITLTLFGKEKPLITIVPPDSSGRFHLDGIDFTGDAKLIASVTDNKDNLKGWLLLDSVSYKPPIINDGAAIKKIKQTGSLALAGDQPEGGDQPIKKTLHTFIQYVEIKNAVQKKYKLSDTIQLGEVRVIARKVDWTEAPETKSRHYLMGDPDYGMKITPLEIVYSTAYDLINVKYLAQGMPLPFGRRIKAPLYMIDGNRVDEGQVKALPLKWVERIDVVSNDASIAALRTLVHVNDSTMTYCDGVISIILKDDANLKPVFHSAAVKFSGYYQSRIFYSPVHHSSLESDYKPDLRTTLFWKPDITIKNKKDLILNYYNSDNSSTVKITVEGITSTGIPLSASTRYEVQ